MSLDDLLTVVVVAVPTSFAFVVVWAMLTGRLRLAGLMAPFVGGGGTLPRVQLLFFGALPALMLAVEVLGNWDVLPSGVLGAISSLSALLYLGDRFRVGRPAGTLITNLFDGRK